MKPELRRLEVIFDAVAEDETNDETESKGGREAGRGEVSSNGARAGAERPLESCIMQIPSGTI